MRSLKSNHFFLFSFYSSNRMFNLLLAMRLITTTTTILALAARVALAEEKNETWPDKCKVLQFANAVSESALLKVHCEGGPPCVQLDLNQCLGVKDDKLVGLKE